MQHSQLAPAGQPVGEISSNLNVSLFLLSTPTCLTYFLDRHLEDDGMAALYESLDTKRTQFRRLILLPGESGGLDDTLVGTLEMVWFDETPEYEALSYVWGSSSPAKRMVLNGKEITITPNLDCALRHLRQASSKRILWVDALCINQDDSAEKAHQIKLMRPIYALASGVLLWLGSGTDETDAAMRSIEKFDKEHWSTYDFQVNFMELLYRPWFTRIWVVQEFLLGRNPKENPTIGCGSVWVRWISFFAAWAHFNDNLPVIQAEYTKQYQKALSSTFELSWIDQVTDVAPPPTSPLAALEERILTGLRSAYGDNFLPQTGHADVSELFEDIRANPAVWTARHTVIQRCSYESPVAKAYWRWLELKQVVPVNYCAFLMHARGTVAISKKSLSFEAILKGTMNLRSTDARDKIYGILGLVSKEARDAIPVDCRSICSREF